MSVRKLTLGEIIEVDGRRYEIVSTRDGDATLETPHAHGGASRHRRDPAGVGR